MSQVAESMNTKSNADVLERSISSVSSTRRAFDIALALSLMIVLSPGLIVVAALIKLTSKGPVLYWSNRIGLQNVIFRMPKFRTMRTDTPIMATHLMTEPERYITPIGKTLRQLSLDETPQLLSILKGDMTFIGPRPALYTQHDLIALRTEKSIHKLVPGLTGWAQVNGRDDLNISEKVDLDEYYLHHRSVFLDCRIIFLTCAVVLLRQGVRH